ncbi:MAG: hypothetical protein ACFE96_15540 [Candidatus Hermodarchaeota archaeon]
MSSKVVSYFDWTLGFKSDSSDNVPKQKSTTKRNLNSIGMTNDDFKSYLNKWKSKNL